MSRVLLTAFQPYDRWATNASWLALVELARELPEYPRVTTRLYPVDLDAALERLQGDLDQQYDYAILTGQAPGRTRIELETIGLNVATRTACESTAVEAAGRPIVPGGPVAYASNLPAEPIYQQLRLAGIPAAISHHGGTFLGNALLYSALHQIQTRQLQTRAIFVHLPLDTLQAARQNDPVPSLPTTLCAHALRILLQALPTVNRQA